LRLHSSRHWVLDTGRWVLGPRRFHHCLHILTNNVRSQRLLLGLLIVVYVVRGHCHLFMQSPYALVCVSLHDWFFAIPCPRDLVFTVSGIHSNRSLSRPRIHLQSRKPGTRTRYPDGRLAAEVFLFLPYPEPAEECSKSVRLLVQPRRFRQRSDAAAADVDPVKYCYKRSFGRKSPSIVRRAWPTRDEIFSDVRRTS